MLSPKNDYIFKKIFGENKKDNKLILKSFLNSIFGEDLKVNEVEVVNPIIEGWNNKDKKSILDIRAKVNKNVSVNIEIQIINQYNIINRSLYYLSRMYSMSLDKGQKYKSLNKCITINILDFEFNKEDKEFHNKYYLKN